MAYVSDPNLAGFNPLKAIGRALGASGRALVSAIPGVGPAATAVLNVAAKMPAKGETQGVPGAVQTVATVAAPATDSGAAMLEKVAQLIAAQNQPQTQPTYIPMNSQPAAPAAAATPPWLIPAAIGGFGLMLVMMMGKK
jgi:hypothetical protein